MNCGSFNTFNTQCWWMSPQHDVQWQHWGMTKCQMVRGDTQTGLWEDECPCLADWIVLSLQSWLSICSWTSYPGHYPGSDNLVEAHATFWINCKSHFWATYIARFTLYLAVDKDLRVETSYITCWIIAMYVAQKWLLQFTLGVVHCSPWTFHVKQQTEMVDNRTCQVCILVTVNGHGKSIAANNLIHQEHNGFCRVLGKCFHPYGSLPKGLRNLLSGGIGSPLLGPACHTSPGIARAVPCAAEVQFWFLARLCHWTAPGEARVLSQFLYRFNDLRVPLHLWSVSYQSLQVVSHVLLVVVI